MIGARGKRHVMSYYMINIAMRTIVYSRAVHFGADNELVGECRDKVQCPSMSSAPRLTTVAVGRVASRDLTQ